MHTLPYVFIYQLFYTIDWYHQFSHAIIDIKAGGNTHKQCCGRITITILNSVLPPCGW